MNLSPYELVLIAGGFTVVGAFIGGWIGYRNALNIYKVSEFNKAASTFRNAFYPELIYLRRDAKVVGAGSSSDLGEFLFHGYIHRHLKALETFRDYLSPKERHSIDETWQKYCHHPDNQETLYFEQYSTKTNTQDSTATMKKFALGQIEDILKFAKHK